MGKVIKVVRGVCFASLVDCDEFELVTWFGFVEDGVCIGGYLMLFALIDLEPVQRFWCR